MQYFQLSETAAYQDWRAYKLHHARVPLSERLVAIHDPQSLSDAELQKLSHQLATTNMVLYQSERTEFSKDDLHGLAGYFGLERFDKHLYASEGVSEIRVLAERKQGEFIPYTPRRLGWHTDGYYNNDHHWVTAILLHCNQPALEGGLSQVVDPDILYIALRDANPNYIEALMADDAMTIPGYDDDLGHHRPESKGPVFWVNETGHLQLRYTQRKTYIKWSDKPLLQEAREFIDHWLETSDLVISHQLLSGQGFISNNVLHNRSAFTDDPAKPRCLLRARYRDTIQILE